MSGIRAALQPETAREAFQAYQRMGADLERQGRFAQAAIAYSNASTSARALGRLQDALVTSQKAVAVAELGYVFSRDNPLYAKLAEAKAYYWDIFREKVKLPAGMNLYKYSL